MFPILSHNRPYKILKRKVRKGIKLLNSEAPDWFRRIKTNQLDLNSVNDDILGQIYGHYLNGLRSLGIHDAEEYGFSGKSEEENRKLKLIWTSEIRNMKRQSGNTPQYSVSKQP